MEMIQSFSVDHTRIVPGIFTSRVDHLGDETVTTYDIRLKRPNREPVIDVGAMHSLEHIIATNLRNDPDWKDEVIYWGPMGCLTGFYMIVKGRPAASEMYPVMREAFRHMSEYEGEVPGAAPVNCGNYLMHDLPMAKWEAARFAAYLASADQNVIFEYPRADKLKLEGGGEFFDS